MASGHRARRAGGGRLEERAKCDGGVVLPAGCEHRTASDHGAPDRLVPEVAVIGYRIAGVALLAFALTLSSDSFLTADNLLNVLRQASLLFLVASGLTLVILGAGLDLSIGATLGLSACLAAAAIKVTGTISAGVAAGVSCGVVIGLVNGMMITQLRLPPFIATYGML